MPTIYERMIAAGVKTDSHESDLYVPATPEALEVILAFREESGEVVPTVPFRNQKDGTPWLDIPFRFDPWWEEHANLVPIVGRIGRG